MAHGPDQVILSEETRWEGRVEGDHFVVEDIVRGGASARRFTGKRPPLRPIPLEKIRENGWQVVRGTEPEAPAAE